ncbi:hypothetical protein [Pseudofrankia asymbiotica]|uniref:Aminoglycoside phosphotransferase n=1 Tax=Pseudofrankia asymbiotica TaxID=1834516 RepID=A0A1V2II86_9ACTN|nr:hypothetical protein [Pseudofrankia asymbiotica]ONH32827.1 hypothetical protein BL253_03640 [Pseudofrankia asymbiotica]
MSQTPRLDLRSGSHDEVLARVERALDVRLNQAAAVRKRRSIGLPTDAGTWVRVEARPASKVTGQGWNGTETAAALQGVAMPGWYQGVSWAERDAGLLWRADETDYVAARPVKPGGILTEAPALDEAWWSTLARSLAALAGADTTRVATPHTVPISQARLSATIGRVFGDQLDTTLDRWVPAHADLNWANLTAPGCVLLDWEDWGLAPAGLDAANLLVNSLAIPALADRVRDTFAAELASRTGRIVTLFLCADIVTAPADYSGPLLEPAGGLVEELLKALQA